MSHVPAPGASGRPGPSGLLDVLRTWLRAGSNLFSPETEAPAACAGGPASAANGPLRVLVVDDNPVNLMLISAMMETRGFVPLLASDGAEAVALATELPFDLVLMDLQMPVLDGLRATSAIRRFEAGASRPPVPVIAYTGLSPGEGVTAAHGMNGRLNKPCTDQELDDCLVRWCPTYRPTPAWHGAAADDDGGWQAVARLQPRRVTGAWPGSPRT